MSIPETTPTTNNYLPQGELLKRNIRLRRRRGRTWQSLFVGSIVVAILALVALIYSIVNDSISLIAIVNKVDPATLSDQPLEDLSSEELGTILNEYEGLEANRVRTIFSEKVLGMSNEQFREVARNPVKDVLGDKNYPAEVADEIVAKLDKPTYINILVDNLAQEEVYQIVIDEIVQPDVVGSWSLSQALTERENLEAKTLEKHPSAIFEYKFWVSGEFLSGTYATEAQFAGIRTAILGSIWMIFITILIAFPLGVGAAIYLEEYATDNALNKIIKVNISNLAGVPSIVYGMLGLVIFVRAMEPLTSGSLFTGEDSATANGRTVLAASMTMALLILPIIIINAQEAIRSVPSSLRQASYGLGATKWQTVWNHVLPNALPGILTGTILAMSRAIGETAPLIVVGASTRITKDPDGPFSKFTVLPMQIFQWTKEAEPEFQSVAAAGIIILLLMLLTMNATAIFLRNKYSRRF